MTHPTITKELAVKLAREAGFSVDSTPWFASLERFAESIYKLGRNAGLEEAAQLGRIGDRVKNSTVVEFVGEIYELKDNTP